MFIYSKSDCTKDDLKTGVKVVITLLKTVKNPKNARAALEKAIAEAAPDTKRPICPNVS